MAISIQMRNVEIFWPSNFPSGNLALRHRLAHVQNDVSTRLFLVASFAKARLEMTQMSSHGGDRSADYNACKELLSQCKKVKNEWAPQVLGKA